MRKNETSVDVEETDLGELGDLLLSVAVTCVKTLFGYTK